MTRRTEDALNQSTESDQKVILAERGGIYIIIPIIYILIISLARRMSRPTFVPETIFRRSIRLKRTDRTCWTIQTHSDELN